MNTIAERLKKLREVRGLSQRAFAQLLGVHQPSYSRYETSDDDRFVYPGSDIVIRICKLFDCKAGWLLGIEDDSAAPTATFRDSADPREIKTGDIKGNGNIVGIGSNNTIINAGGGASSSSSTAKKKGRQK